MEYVISGGAGFIGSHLVDALVEEGHQVYVVDDLSTGREANIHQKAFFPGPKCCGQVTSSEFPEGCVVIHLAARPACNASLFAPVADAENNYLPGVRFLTAAVQSRPRRIVLVSSMSVYGDAEPLPYHEDYSPLPRDPYAINKLAIESTLKVLAQSQGVDWAIVRPQHVFGPRQRADLAYRNIIPRWIRKGFAGEPLPVYGSCDLSRAFSPVGLVVRGMLAAAHMSCAAGEVFNLGSSTVRSLYDLVGIVQEVCGRTLEVELKPSPPTLLKDSYGIVTKAKELLGVDELPGEFESTISELVAELVCRDFCLEEVQPPVELAQERFSLIYR